jgi:aminoglycoside phosphotransferase (APT) family kinase protein
MPELSEINTRLADYFGAPPVRLRVLANGWETTIFEFALESPPPRLPMLPPKRPLVLRFYLGPLADSKGTREHFVMRKLSEAGYCVPTPYAFESDHGPLGAPFMILQKVAGGPLFAARSFPAAFKTFALGFFGFVREQARLHRMDPARMGLGEMPGALAAGSSERAPLLDRVLGVIADRIESGPLPGLKDALARLRERAAKFRDAPSSVLHMDYHPQNVLVSGARVTGVIDWVSADVGDRHLDAATTAVILSSSALEHPRWMRDNPVGNSLRALFASLYIPLYHAMAPLDLKRFRYCQAVASVLRLSTLGMMRTRGPETVGYRPDAIAEVTPSVVRLLSRYAARKSGVAIDECLSF